MANVSYASVVGSLMYAMVYIRLDISHAVGVLSRYMTIPGKEHLTAIKRVFMYLWCVAYFVIYYHGNYEEVEVHGFVNFDSARDIDGRRSTSGYVFKLFGGAIR